MHCREQLKSETCFLKKVVSFKYGRTVSARVIKLQYLMKTAGNFRKTEERNEKDRERRVNDFCKTKGRGTKSERSKIWLF